MSISSFEDLGIRTEILDSIRDMGFEAPTRIQSTAIPKILEGRDIAGQAQTGTGKTAAFAIPVLNKIDTASGDVQALILCPTRELAVQVTGEFIKLSSHMEGVHITPVYGGQPIQRQIKQLKQGTQVVAGTPGRVIDHLKRGTLNLDNLKMVVLDEADEMLNMGFRDDIETILGFAKSGEKRQIVMFSATISSQIKKIMGKWFHNPEMIRIEGEAATADGVEQYLLEVRDSLRTEAICRLMDINDYKMALIFCNTKRKCDSLVGEMQSRGYSSDVLHGDLNQNLRNKVMDKFRRGQVDVLIATDVAARGLDVDDIDVVFNYDIPQDPEYYVHRIGRTGRAGRNGAAYTFSAGRKKSSIRYIEKQIKTKLKVIPMPSAQEVQKSRIDAIGVEMIETLQKGGLRPFIEQIESLISDQYTPVEAAAALLKMRPDSQLEAPGESNHSSSGSPFNGKKQKRRSVQKDRTKEPFYKEFKRGGRKNSRKRR
ncbi:MAG: DEAD/DEAH box helicase [Balneolaceae bacterium]